MIKALSAVAVAAFVAAALTVLPGFAPQVEAGVPRPSPRPTGSTFTPSAVLLAAGVA